VTIPPLARPHDIANQPGTRLVDCSHDLADVAAGARAYAEAHLPGAIHAHLDEDLSGPRDGSNGRHPLPDPQRLAAWLARHGIRGSDHVVAYDRSGGMYAARLWWLLRWIGHERVSVLDGGFQAWQAAGLPLEREARAWPAVPASTGQADRGFWVDAGFVERNLATREALIVDARGAGRFAGVGETIDPRAGHIPGACNRPYTDNLDADGRFKPADVLRSEWRAVLGEHAPDRMVAQCGSGVSACHNLLALEVAGLPGARLYPGSWSEWCSDPERPIATGAV